MDEVPTPDWTHVVFKTPAGHFYAVSERVINMGYEPKEGVLVATDEERFEFYLTLKQRATAASETDRRAMEALTLRFKNPGGTSD